MRNLTLIAAFAVVASANAELLTLWNFNAGEDANPATGTFSPFVGSGDATLLGVTSIFASGDASGGSTDPVMGDDSALNTTGYAPQGTEDGQRGVRFDVSTVGYEDVVVSFDTRHSNTASRYLAFEYTTDGDNFIRYATFVADQDGDRWYNNRTVELTDLEGVADNADFGFRIVAIFEPGTSAYLASTSTSTYSPNGTLRYDQVAVNADAVPEPASLAALGLGALALLRRRRKS